MVQKKETGEKLAALFALKIGNISGQLEETGREFFCADSKLMDEDEVADLSGEFVNLIAGLLCSKDPNKRTSPQFHALEMFFSGLAQRMLMRGGNVEDVVRYAQQLQYRPDFSTRARQRNHLYPVTLGAAVFRPGLR